MSGNIPQYGDKLYLVNILNEEREEYKIIEVTQKQQANHGKLFYRCRIMRTEAGFFDEPDFLDYYPDDGDYFIDFLGTMIPVPVTDNARKAQYRLSTYKKNQKADFLKFNGLQRNRYLRSLFSLQREILGYDTSEADKAETRNTGILRYYYCHQPKENVKATYFHHEINHLTTKIIKEIFPCDENDVYYNNDWIVKFCNIVGEGNAAFIVVTHQYKGDWARSFDSKDDFRRLPEECYFYQKNFNAKIIESNEYPRGFGIVMQQNVIWGGFENCINLNARTVADMPMFTQIFAYDSVDVDNTTI